MEEQGRHERDHVHSVFANSCLAVPRCPNTRLPANGLKKHGIPVECDARICRQCGGSTLCSLRIEGISPKKADTEQSVRHTEHDDRQHDQGLEESELLLSQVSQFTDEHQRTLAMLESLYRNQQQLKEVTLSLLKDIHEQTGLLSGELLKDEEPLSRSEAVDGDYSVDSSGSWSTLSSTSEENSENEPIDFYSTGVSAVDHMWDSFSLASYVSSLEDVSHIPTKLANAAAVKVWRPRITIPKPFVMSVREENKIRRKSKSVMIAEREHAEREAKINTKLRQHFRANPIPASTFLPLYDMLNAKREQRQRHLKTLSKQMLKASEKPFSFQQRETERRKMKARNKELQEELETRELKERSIFKAKPVPKHVLDSTVDEQIKEREDYRKIRTRVRAVETLDSSHLPSRMQGKGREYTIGSLRKLQRENMQKREFLTEHHVFQPSINSRVPDHDTAYQNFQAQLQAKKQACVTTVVRPFKLKTAERNSRKRDGENGVHIHILDAGSKQSVPVIRPSQNPPVQARSALVKPSQQQYASATTRSVQFRQQATQEMLFNRAEEEEVEETRREQQQLREKHIQRTVMERSIGNDLTGWLEDKRRKNIQELKSVLNLPAL